MHANTFLLALHELRCTLKGKARKIVVGAIVLIPLLYGALYLWAFTNPYKTLDAVPVAVVIDDRGAIIQDEHRNLGNDIKKRLEDLTAKQEGFQWNFVSSDEARDGLANGRYFMSVTIPENFSACIASAEQANPVEAKLLVKYDQASNMLASQLGASGFKTLRSEISEAVVEEYWDAFFKKMEDSRKKLGEAADGAGDLADGATKAADGARTLNDATGTLERSTGTLHEGLQTLDKGTRTLRDGATQAASGADTFTKKCDELSKGAQSLERGASALSQGSTQLAQHSTQLAQGTQKLHQAVQANNAATKKQFEQLLAAASKPQASKQSILTMLQGVGLSLSTQQDALDSQLASISQGATQLSQGAQKLENSAAELHKGTQNISGGTSRLAQGATALSQANERISHGAENLHDGAAKAANGAASLHDGAGKLHDGTGKLAGRMPDLTDGANKLHDGLNEAHDTAKLDNPKLHSTMMSSPVALHEENFTTVNNYGTGFAPYFISIGLWVGSLISTFIMRVLNRRALLCGMNPIKSTLISYVPLAVVGAAQAVILMLVIQFVIRLQINNVGAYYGLGILAGCVFMAVMQTIIMAFKVPGRLVAIILLMLQITSAAGTFPIQMTPPFFQTVHPALPMTYSIMGLRQAMAGGNGDVMAFSALVLVAFGIVALALSSIIARHRQMVRMTDLHPIITLD